MAPEQALQPDRPWAEPAATVVAALDSHVQRGLTSATAAERLARFGPNELQTAGGRSRLAVLVAQFANLMIGLLAVAALISAVIGDWQDSLLIAVIVIANAAIGYVQERRAEDAVAALRKLARPQAKAWRGGALVEIPAAEVVPGDLIEVAAGDRVPGDARLCEGVDLTADEAPLTGESLPVEKSPEPNRAETLLPDRTAMLYAGTAVATGHGRAVVVATGMRTELGSIAQMLTTARGEPTPLELRLAALSKRLAIAVGAVCVLLFVAGWLRGGIPLNVLFLTAVSLAVAAVPEGLPAVITVTLALGSQRMARRRAIVRQLSAVETLGSVNVICSDKTGTLTQNRMAVADLVLPEGDDERARVELLRAGALCNAAQWSPDGEAVGSPTEVALLQAAADGGQDPAGLRQRWTRRAELPFSSERKRMSTLEVDAAGETVVFVKGAAEQILERSTRLRTAAGDAALEEDGREQLRARAEQLTRSGRRVLGLATRRWDRDDSAPPEADQVERELTFLGFVGLVDPVREEAGPAIADCRSAGIRPVMITGDHRGTAQTIAADLGLLAEGDEVVSGGELDELSDEELARRAPRVAVYARVSPAHKLRIVRAHQAHGSVVAMTGDGVNDAPALKQADIGVAMGITGTDVSKEASNMVLADDNFATIVAAVREGRVVYDNIRKFVRYLLTTNMGEVLVLAVATALFVDWPLPLLPIHLLWINLVTDGLPALALGFEPAESDVMRRRPRARRESIFAGGMARDIFLYGGLMAAACLGLYAWYLKQPAAGLSGDAAEAYARTIVFITLALFQLFYVLAIRSSSTSFFRQGLWSNYRLTGAVAVGIGMQLALVYTPHLRDVFHIARLSFPDLAIAMGTSTTAFFAAEAHKALRNRRGDGNRGLAPGG